MRAEAGAHLPRQASQAAAVRFLQVAPGRVQHVQGVQEASQLDGVFACALTIGPGDTVNELRSSWDRVGSAMALAPTPQQAEQLAAKAIESIEVTLA